MTTDSDVRTEEDVARVSTNEEVVLNEDHRAFFNFESAGNEMTESRIRISVIAVNGVVMALSNF